MPPDHIPQGHIVDFERDLGAVEPLEAALGGAAEHAEDLDANGLHEGDFFPQGVEFCRVGGVIVEVDEAGGIVEVDSGDDEVGDGDEVDGFGEEGEQGDEIVSVVVGLVV